MPRATWPLHLGCPAIRVVITLAAGNQPLPCHLLADTGAGSATSTFDLLVGEADCIRCGGNAITSVRLAGAYARSFTLYLLPVQIPELNFARFLRVIGMTTPPPGFAGIAGFRFLNLFT